MSITNNSTAAGATLTIGPSTVIGMASNNNIEPALLNYGPGTTVFSGAIATAAGHTVPGLLMNGPGLFDFSGNGTGLSAEIVLDGGTLGLDYSTSTVTKMGGGGQLLIDGGGVINVTPQTGGTVTQGFSFGTTIAGGHTDFTCGGALGTVTLALGSISRDAGATIDVSQRLRLVDF